MNVFLSSTHADLVEHRRKTADAIRRLDHRVIGMETFGARPEEPSLACLAEVEACDVFVGLYAHRYGFVAHDSPVSITEREFDHAIQHRKPVLAFVIEPDHAWPPEMIDAGEAKEQIVRLRQKIELAVVRDTFTTPEDLAVRVATAVARFAQGLASMPSGVSDLVAILELRREAVVRMMQAAKDSALSMRRQGGGRRTDYATEEQLISRLNAIQQLFQELHERNVVALRSGQFAVSHEITSEIHHLLWIRERDTFWAAHAIPEAQYRVTFSSHAEIAALYPASTLDEPESPTQKQMFPESSSLQHAEQALLQRDSLNRLVQQQRDEAAAAERRRVQEAADRELAQIDAERGVLSAAVDAEGWVVCPFCQRKFSSTRSPSWDGTRHRSCKSRLRLMPPEAS